MTSTSSNNTMKLRDLLAEAASAGHVVTERQVERWRRRGLIPRPLQRHQRGVKGSTSEWPAAAGAQLVALCEMHARLRNLDDLLVAMWWHGWPVDERRLLGVLDKRLASLPVTKIREADTSDEEQLDAIEALVGEADFTRMGDPLRQAFRRVGRSAADRKDLATAVLELGSGIMPPFEAVDVGREERSLLDIVATGFGFDGLARQLTEVGDPTSVDDLANSLQNLADNLTSMAQHAREAIAAGDMDRLNRARDDARCLAQIEELASSGIVPDADEGLWYIGQFMVPDEPAGWVQGLMCLLWLRHQYPDTVDEHLSAISDAIGPARVFKAIPELAEMLATVDGNWDPLPALIETRPDLIEQIQSLAALHVDPPQEAARPSDGLRA